MDVGDRVASHRPLATSKALLGDRVNGAGVVGALAPGGMHRRRDERHPRDNLRLRFEIAFGQQTRVGESFGEVEENCGDLGQRAAVDQQESAPCLRG